MNLLSFDKEKNLNISAEAVMIPEFSALWKRDKSKDKVEACKELAYIYYMGDYDSPYLSYSPEIRGIQLKKDMGIKKISKEMEEGVKKYKMLQDTPSIRFLDSAIKAMESMEKYFNKVNFSERDSKGSAVYKPTEVSKCLKDSGGIMDSLARIRDKVKTEIYNRNTIRGGSETNIFEE